PPGGIRAYDRSHCCRACLHALIQEISVRPRFRNALFRLSAGYRRRIPLAAVAAVLALLAGVLSTPKVAYASTNFYDTTHTIGNFGQYSNSIVDGSLATGNGYVVIATSAAVNVY